MSESKGTYRISELVLEETRQHALDIERYESGGLSAEMFKSLRVPRGIYEQRQNGLFMVRVRIPGGLFRTGQARNMAQMSRQYGSGVVHVTTRQDVQLHEVSLRDTALVLDGLLSAGLSPLGGGGNTVRNITASPHSGLLEGEAFDTIPHAIALTDYLLGSRSSYNLPRKFKVAFSSGPDDTALARVNDLGFIAEVRDGRKGFAVYVGGGMGVSSRVGHLVTPFLPEEDVLRMAEAAVRMFDRHGDRRNRHAARLRFAVERLGLEAFLDELNREVQITREEGVPDLVAVIPEGGPLPEGSPAPAPEALSQEAADWMATSVRAQKQTGLYVVTLHLGRGDLPADDLDRVAALSDRLGAGELRADRRQNLFIPHVPGNRLEELFDGLSGLSVDVFADRALPRIVACTGADTCRLGLCRSQDLADAISEAAGQAGVPAEVFDRVEMYISGCPNNCGQHGVANLGFFGGVRRAGSRSYPLYNVAVGGGDREGTFFLSGTELKVPARRVPRFTAALLRDYADRGDGTFADYWDGGGSEVAGRLAEELSGVPAYGDEPEFYRDWGSSEDFSLAGRSQGECGAGVIELISEELKKSEQAYDRALEHPQEAGQALLEAVTTAAGALLVTRGIEPGDPDRSVKEFERHMIDGGLAPEIRMDLLMMARAELRRPKGLLDGHLEEVRAFLDEVQGLYDAMDASLNFPVRKQQEQEPAAAGDGEVSELNLRGVPCPMNFVHAKVALEKLEVDSLLDVIVDLGEPSKNVPASFRDQGQEVLSEEPEGPEHVRIRIRRTK